MFRSLLQAEACSRELHNAKYSCASSPQRPSPRTRSCSSFRPPNHDKTLALPLWVAHSKLQPLRWGRLSRRDLHVRPRVSMGTMEIPHLLRPALTHFPFRPPHGTLVGSACPISDAPLIGSAHLMPGASRPLPAAGGLLGSSYAPHSMSTTGDGRTRKPSSALPIIDPLTRRSVTLPVDGRTASLLRPGSPASVEIPAEQVPPDSPDMYATAPSSPDVYRTVAVPNKVRSPAVSVCLLILYALSLRNVASNQPRDARLIHH